MTLRRVSRRAAAATAVTAAMAAAPAPATAANASFTAPVELAAAQFGLAATSATDAAGTTTALITGDGAPKLLERPAGAPWPAPTTRLPGDPRGTKGPVIAAAGQGALAIAWRVDTPRKYSGIQAEVRDPGGTLSTPIDIAGNDANGVRHPALAIDPAGDTLLAYNTDTRTNHLSLRGAIAVTHRPAHGSFAKPVVLDDAPSSPPAVALAPDGTGIVAWTHNRRVYAVSIARGNLGQVKEVASSRGLRAVIAAAGPRGEATIAWVASRESNNHSEVRAVRRSAGRSFTGPRVVASTASVIPQLTLAADEAGRMTAAWIEYDFKHRVNNRFTTSVHAATAAPAHGFGTPRVVATRSTRDRGSLSIAAASGRVALAWGDELDRKHGGVQAIVGRPAALGQPQTIAAATLGGDFFVATPSAHITLAPSGAATALAVLPTEPAPMQTASRLVAIDG